MALNSLYCADVLLSSYSLTCDSSIVNCFVLALPTADDQLKSYMCVVYIDGRILYKEVSSDSSTSKHQAVVGRFMLMHVYGTTR